MKFRPCIDLHSGKVKQIVGSTLTDKSGDTPQTNFESTHKPSFYSELYKKDAIYGGHVIMLGAGNEEAAIDALNAFPGGLHIGGGLNPDNSAKYLDAGASHVIVTSYVFKDGKIDWDNLNLMINAVGKKRLVLDLSCKKKDSEYFVVTDRWQNFTEFKINAENIDKLSSLCDEFLIHAADVEGMQSGIDTELVDLLSGITDTPITYAGGIRSLADMEIIEKAGSGKIDATVGSALDIFGGKLKYEDVVKWHKQRNG